MFFYFVYLSIYPIYPILSLSYPIFSYPILSYPILSIHLYIYTSIHLLYLSSISLDPPSTLRHIISPRHKYHIPVLQGETQGVGICIFAPLIQLLWYLQNYIVKLLRDLMHRYIYIYITNVGIIIVESHCYFWLYLKV